MESLKDDLNMRTKISLCFTGTYVFNVTIMSEHFLHNCLVTLYSIWKYIRLSYDQGLKATGRFLASRSDGFHHGDKLLWLHGA